MIAIALSSTVLLAGCVSGLDKETSAKLTRLDNKVTQLKSDVNALSKQVRVSSSETLSARQEAKRANDRIDAIGESYSK